MESEIETTDLLAGTSITFVVDYYSEWTGLKWNIDQFADQLMSEGCFVTILCFDGDSQTEFVDGGKTIRQSKHPGFFPPVATHLNYKVYREMNRIEDSTDLFHIFNTNCSAGAGIYKQFGGNTPVLSTLNNWGIVCPSYKLEQGNPYTNHSFWERIKCSYDAARNQLEKILSIPYSQYFLLEKKWPSKNLDQYAVLSEYVAEVFRANGFPNRIQVVGNHLDHSFIENANRINSSDKKDEQLQILYVGRLIESKGLNLLLDALDESNRNDIEIKLAGEGRLKNKIENRSYTECLGFVDRDELPALYKRSDLFVHPATRPEPFGKTILEALHCDTPVLCSDIGAPPEIAGNACLTFESGSVDSLQSQIEYLANNPDKLFEIRSHCTEEREKYSFKTTYLKTKQIYTELLGI